MKADAIALELSNRYQYFVSTQENKKLNYDHRININTFSLMEILFSLCSLKSRHHQYAFHFLFNTTMPGAEERIYKLKTKYFDVDIGSKLPLDKNISNIKIFSSGVSVIARKGLLSKGVITVEEFLSARHVSWSSLPDFYCESINDSIKVNEILQSRNIAIISASLINMVSLCSRSNCIMIIPDCFIHLIQPWFGIERIALPPEIPLHYDCYMHYEMTLEHDERKMKILKDVVLSIQSSQLNV